MTRFDFFKLNRMKQFEKNCIEKIKDDIRKLIRKNASQFTNIPKGFLNSNIALSSFSGLLQVLDLIYLNLTKSNLALMLNLVLNASRVSSTVKFKIIENGLAIKILDILESNLNQEGQLSPPKQPEFEDCLVSFVGILTQADLPVADSRLEHSCWDLLCRLFWLLDSRLRRPVPSDRLVIAISTVIECFCRIKTFSRFLDSSHFKQLFWKIQQNKDQFEFDKFHWPRFQSAYSAFFCKMIASADSRNPSSLFRIFGDEGAVNRRLSVQSGSPRNRLQSSRQLKSKCRNALKRIDWFACIVAPAAKTLLAGFCTQHKAVRLLAVFGRRPLLLPGSCHCRRLRV